jgi:hypothetical protein
VFAPLLNQLSLVRHVEDPPGLLNPIEALLKRRITVLFVSLHTKQTTVYREVPTIDRKPEDQTARLLPEEPPVREEYLCDYIGRQARVRQVQLIEQPNLELKEFVFFRQRFQGLDIDRQGLDWRKFPHFECERSLAVSPFN